MISSKQNSPKTAIVAGGGFIGLETAENLTERGIKVTLLQMEEQVMPPFDYDMACILHSHMRQKGVDLRLLNKVSQLNPSEEGITAEIDSKPSVTADMVIVALGVVPETQLAAQAGLELGPKGAVMVDAHMRTSDPDIYRGGRCGVHQEFYHAGRFARSVGGACEQAGGRIAADNICGIPSRYVGAQGSSVLKMFDLTAAATGLNERAAGAAKIPFDSVVLFTPNHATYYPGAKNMTLKVLYDTRDGKIIGAQAIGFSGVDKRIDVFGGGDPRAHDGGTADGAGSCVCAALFFGERSREHGGVRDRKLHERASETATPGRKCRRF